MKVVDVPDGHKVGRQYKMPDWFRKINGPSEKRYIYIYMCVCGCFLYDDIYRRKGVNHLTVHIKVEEASGLRSSAAPVNKVDKYVVALRYEAPL